MAICCSSVIRRESMREIFRLNADQIKRLGIDPNRIFGGDRELEHLSLCSGNTSDGMRELAFNVRTTNPGSASIEVREHEVVTLLRALEDALFERGVLPAEGIPRLLPDDERAYFEVDGRKLELPDSWNREEEDPG